VLVLAPVPGGAGRDYVGPTDAPTPALDAVDHERDLASSRRPGGSDEAGGTVDGDASIDLADMDLDDLGLGGESADLAELDLEALLGSVSTVSRRRESLVKAPASVTVLDRSDIRRSGARAIGDVLRSVPGVQVVKTAPGNFLVSLRGMAGLSGNNVVVLVDGIPMNRSVDGNVDWGGLPVHIDDIERIEVVRGPVSPVYGPNAYAGVINIITTRRLPLGPWGAARTSLGVDHHGGLSERMLGTVGDNREKLTWQVSMDVHRDALFVEGAPLEDDGDENTLPVGSKYAGFGKLAWRPREHHELSVSGGLAASEHSGVDELVLDTRAQRSALAFAVLSYRALGLPSVVDSVGVWARTRAFGIREQTGSDQGFSYGGLSTIEGVSGADVQFDLPHAFWLAVGASGGGVHASAPFLHPDENDRFRLLYGIYADLGVDVRKTLKLSGAVRMDDSAMLPRPRASYRVAGVFYREHWALRLTGGSAYREPTFVEVGGRFRDPDSGLILLEGTPGLESPRVHSVELGAVLAFPRAPTLKPTVYVAHMQDLMVADFEPLVQKTFRNDRGLRFVFGGELELEWPLAQWLAWRGSFAGLWWHSAVDDLSATVAVPEQNSSMTAWTGLHGSWIADRLSGAAGVGYVSPRRFLVRAGIPPQIIDIEIGHRVRPEGTLEFQIVEERPLWLWMRAYSTLPHAAVESPFPGASRLGTAVFAGMGYRG
jgi:iron complex outermembrane receptor protein